METTLQGIELSVALLMDDLASTKEIAHALRQYNILAHHYQSLDEFWVSMNIQTPQLVIVDVTKMSQGSVQFKSHPKVIDGSLSYAFFSKDSTKILLQSTLGLRPFGYLHLDSSLAMQVVSLVERKLESFKKDKNLRELETRIHRLQSRSQRLISERSNAEEFKAHFDFMRVFCAEIEDEATHQDFTHSLLSKLEKWEAVDAYGVYELNQSGQKLISPDISKRKHHPFPSLWLGQVNTHGIEKFAQDMALQVANDLFETAPRVIRIYAANSQPDMLLYIGHKEERMETFPWDVFESMLSSSLRRLKLYSQLPQYTAQFMPMWEALDNMDRMQKTGEDSDSRILCLSFIPLIEVVKKRPQNKFYWASFYNDFFLQFSGRVQKTTKLSLLGPWHVLFFIPKENFETESLMLQSFIRQFSYWKFFEDNSQILSEEMYPILRLIPPSSSHYFRLFEKEFEEMKSTEEGRRMIVNSKNDHKRLSI